MLPVSRKRTTHPTEALVISTKKAKDHPASRLKALPLELQQMILEYLGQEDLLHLSCTNRHWNKLVLSESNIQLKKLYYFVLERIDTTHQSHATRPLQNKLTRLNLTILTHKTGSFPSVVKMHLTSIYQLSRLKIEILEDLYDAAPDNSPLKRTLRSALLCHNLQTHIRRNDDDLLHATINTSLPLSSGSILFDALYATPWLSSRIAALEVIKKTKEERPLKEFIFTLTKWNKLPEALSLIESLPPTQERKEILHQTISLYMEVATITPALCNSISKLARQSLPRELASIAHTAVLKKFLHHKP